MTIIRGRVNIMPEESFMSIILRAVDNIHHKIAIINQTLLKYFIEYILDNYFRTLPIATNTPGRPRCRILNLGRGKIFLLSPSSRPILKPANRFIKWVRCGVLSRGIKPPGCVADQSPPKSANVKIRGFIHPLPYTFSWRSIYLIKHRDNFICYQSGSRY
jgi:hypothetical protein